MQKYQVEIETNLIKGIFSATYDAETDLLNMLPEFQGKYEIKQSDIIFNVGDTFTTEIPLIQQHVNTMDSIFPQFPRGDKIQFQNSYNAVKTAMLANDYQGALEIIETTTVHDSLIAGKQVLVDTLKSFMPNDISMTGNSGLGNSVPNNLTI